MNVACVFDNARLMLLGPESNERDRNLLLPSFINTHSIANLIISLISAIRRLSKLEGPLLSS